MDKNIYPIFIAHSYALPVTTTKYLDINIFHITQFTVNLLHKVYLYLKFKCVH